MVGTMWASSANDVPESFGLGVFGGIGAGVGALIGSAVKGGAIYEAPARSTVQVAPILSPRRAGLALAVRW